MSSPLSAIGNWGCELTYSFTGGREWNRVELGFGGDLREHDPRGPDPSTRPSSSTDLDADVSECVRDPGWQLSDLVCYFMNLADDLQKWLAHGSIDPEVLPQVREEVAAVMAALDTRAPISPIPAIPLPPRPARPSFSHRGDRERTVDDDEIPF